MNTKSSVVQGARMWGRNLRIVVAIAALTWIPVYAVQAAAAILLDVPTRMAAVVAAVRQAHSPASLDVDALAAYAAVSLALMLAGVAFGQSAMVAAYAAGERGESPAVGTSFATARRRAAPFLGAVALVALLVVLAESILYVAGITMARLGAASLLTVALFAGMVLPLFVAAPFAVAPQAAVLEGARPFDALRRSRRLLRGRYPQALGVLFLLSVIGWVAAAVLGLPVRHAGGGSALILVNAAMAAAGAIVVGPYVVASLTALYLVAGGSASPLPAGRTAEVQVAPRRRIGGLLALGVAAALLVGAGGGNTAVAINTKDDSTDVKVAFKIVRANGDVVAPVNFAFAYASCTSCETAAIAIEVVFVTSTDASVVSPVNEAWAVNYACTDCQTLADAYQFTLTTGGPVHLTPEGNREVAQIRRQLQQLAHSDMSLTDTVVAVQSLTTQLSQVLATQVVPAGGDQGQPQSTAPPNASSAPGPAASPAASPSASPAASPSPSPSASPSPSPSP